MGLGQLYYRLCATPFGHRAARKTLDAARAVGFLRQFRTPLDALYLDHASVASLMHLWRRIHWSSGDGMMPGEQLLAIYRLAATWPIQGDTVELGAWVGLTTCYLAAACRARGSGHVYAVDTFEGTKEGDGRYPSVERFGGSTLQAFRSQVEQAGMAEGITEMVGRTTEAVQRYVGRAIRVLLIDADHSYAGVKADFEAWSPHVAPGGLIIFHDHLLPGIARYIDDEVRVNPVYEPAPGQVVDNVFAVTKRAIMRRKPVRPLVRPWDAATARS